MAYNSGALSLGRNAIVGFGFETTPGTAVSRGQWCRVTSASITKSSTSAFIPDLALGSDGHNTARWLESTDVEFSATIIGYYTNGGLAAALRMCHGGSWATTSGTPNVHVLTPGFTPPYVTIEYVHDTNADDNTLARSELIVGCRVVSATLSVSTAGVLTLAITWQGRSVSNPSLPSPTLAAYTAPISYAHGAVLNWNSTTDVIRSLSLALSTGVTRIDGFGSTGAADHVVSEARTAPVTVTRYKKSGTWVDAQSAATEFDAYIVFSDGTSSFRIDLKNCIMSDAIAAETTSVGLIEESAVLQPRNDGTNPAIKYTLSNADSAAEDS